MSKKFYLISLIFHDLVWSIKLLLEKKYLKEIDSKLMDENQKNSLSIIKIFFNE